MPKCCVPGCRSHPRKKEVSFYRIPAIKTNDRSTSLEQFTKKRNAWLKALRLEDIENVKNPRVCSLHFHSGNMFYGFEIRVEVPENKKDQASLYSSYKHHTTVKFLIGTTPQGSISFISKGFTGRPSDRETVIRSGILNYLSAGL